MESARPRAPFTVYGGREVDLLHPQVEDVDWSWIARALSMTCRFAGSVKAFYSVAEHCVNVADVVSELSPGLELPALIHDAGEAVVGDLVAPLKHSPGFEFYRELDDRWCAVIAQAAGVDTKLLSDPLIKRVDRSVAARERDELIGGTPSEAWKEYLGNGEPARIRIYCLPPAAAEREFLDRLRRFLSKQRQHT